VQEARTARPKGFRRCAAGVVAAEALQLVDDEVGGSAERDAAASWRLVDANGEPVGDHLCLPGDGQEPVVPGDQDPSRPSGQVGSGHGSRIRVRLLAGVGHRLGCCVSRDVVQQHLGRVEVRADRDGVTGAGARGRGMTRCWYQPSVPTP